MFNRYFKNKKKLDQARQGAKYWFDAKKYSISIKMNNILIVKAELVNQKLFLKFIYQTLMTYFEK